MSTYNDADGLVRATYGELVTSTQTIVASGSTQDLFSIEGGLVQMWYLAGHVTTAIAAATDFDLDLDPDDGGSDVALASTLVADSDVIGTIYTLNPTAGGALVATLDVAYNASLAIPITLTTGDLNLAVSGGTGAAGVIKWYLIYTPLDDGAVVIGQ